MERRKPEEENSLSIRIMGEKEIKRVYEEQLLKDFPPEELKPLEVILQQKKEGHYLCYGLYDYETLAAYAFFVQGTKSKCILLDYLAVCGNLRSKGYGGKFLQKLKNEILNQYSGIIFEVESGLTVKDEKEYQTCKRRLAFYQNNGLRFTRISVVLYGVDLVGMYLPIQENQEDEALYEALDDIYQYIYTPKQREQSVLLRLNQEVQIAEGICEKVN